MTILDPVIGQPDGTQLPDPFESLPEMPHLWHVHQAIADIDAGTVHLDHDTDQATINGLPVTEQQDKAITDLIESGRAERLPLSGDMTLTLTGKTLAAQWRGLAIYTSDGGMRCA